MATRNPQQFIAPTLSPDLQRRQLEMQRNQMMAQQLLQSEAPQGQMVSGHYVAPSITQHLAHALRQYQGNKALNELPKQAMELQQAQQDQMLGSFGFKPSPQQLAAGLNGGQPQALPVGGPGQPAMQPSGGGGQGPVLIPGLSAEQSMLALRTLGPQEYMKLVANKGGPINVAPGGSLYNPQTGQVDFTAPKDGISIQNGQATPIAGYADIAAANAAAQTRAEEGAKAQYTLVDMPDGQGGFQKMPLDMAIGVAGGAQPTAPTGGVAVGRAGGLGTTPSPVSQAAATKLNDDWVSGSYRPTLDSAGAASSLKNTITAMRQIPLETGFGTEAQGAAANLLATLGVKNADKVATDVQKFQSLAMDRLQTELMKQKGPQTEGDAQRAGQTFAKLGNTPEANKFIFDFAEAKANMDIRKAQFYEAALPLARKAGDLTEIDRRWRKLQGSIWDDPLLAPYKDM